MKELPAHPNVVLLRGVTIPPEPLTLVTDYCDGGSLLAFLQTHPNLSLAFKIRFIFDIARGMYHLHTAIAGKEVIHRDLAARNILLKESRCLVADFGMARMKIDSDDTGKTKQEIGPLKWMAPEAFLKKQYSAKSDVFSFGVTCYEIVTQSDPWPGLDAVQASHEVAMGARLQLPRDIPQELIQLIESCWLVAPEKRPTFEQICNNLDLISVKYVTEADQVFTWPNPSVPASATTSPNPSAQPLSTQYGTVSLLPTQQPMHYKSMPA